MATQDLESKQVTILDEDLQERREEEEARLDAILQEVMGSGESESPSEEKEV